MWHHRLGHPGEKTMSHIHKHVKGVPKLCKNQFYSCAACLAINMRKNYIGPTKSYNKTQQPSKFQHCELGQHLHMDFSFVRGSDWKQKEFNQKLMTSINGYRAYLFIINRATMCTWIFIATTKHPPISQVEDILKECKGLHRNSTVTTDLGGELGKSIVFRKTVKGADYTAHNRNTYKCTKWTGGKTKPRPSKNDKCKSGK